MDKNNHCICGSCSFCKSGYGCTLDKHHRAENIRLKELLGHVAVVYPKFQNITQRALMTEIEQVLKDTDANTKIQSD